MADHIILRRNISPHTSNTLLFDSLLPEAEITTIINSAARAGINWLSTQDPMSYNSAFPDIQAHPVSI